MHISPYENNNRAIVDIENAVVPHNYFNIVKLKKLGKTLLLSISIYDPKSGVSICDWVTIG